MSIINFPRQKFSASAELRNSPLAKPVRHLEVKLAINGPLAQTVWLEAARAQLPPNAYLTRLIGHVFDLGAHQ